MRDYTTTLLIPSPIQPLPRYILVHTQPRTTVFPTAALYTLPHTHLSQAGPRLPGTARRRKESLMSPA